MGLAGPPATGGFPHFEFGDGSFISTGGVKPFDILSRVVKATDTLTWLSGRHTFKAGADIQYVEYRDQISFFDGEELGRYIENFDIPGNMNITSGAFGRIRDTQTVDQAGPRTVQFSLRYSF